MKRFFTQIFQAGNGQYSSKRFIGIISGLTLCVALVLNTITDSTMQPSDALVNAVALLSFGCLGLTSSEAIFKKKFESKVKEAEAEHSEQ
jgi:hypothetical protein